MYKKNGKIFMFIIQLVITSSYGAHVQPPTVLNSTLNSQQYQIHSNPKISTENLPNTINRVAYKNFERILQENPNFIQWPILKQSSVVQDWNLVCKQLCGAGLGGQPCASHCMNITLSQQEITANAEDILNPNKNVICEDLCKLQLGGNICQCLEAKFSVQIQEDRSLVCKTLCDNSKFNLSGCSSCQKVSFNYDLNNSTIIIIPTTTTTTTTTSTTTTPTTSTTPDWNAICKDLCKTGDGGALCNCDLPPFL